MISEEEVNRLFDLLKDLHGRDKPRDNRTTAIWRAVLEPWDYGQIRAAAIQRARANRHYPDPGELVEYLPPLPSPEPPAPQAAPVRPDQKVEELRVRREQLLPLRRAQGLPATGAEAKAAGWTAEAWWGALARAGLEL